MLRLTLRRVYLTANVSLAPEKPSTPSPLPCGCHVIPEIRGVEIVPMVAIFPFDRGWCIDVADAVVWFALTVWHLFCFALPRFLFLALGSPETIWLLAFPIWSG